jgi:predicted TIM-barrel fold metal-dependent hydrolase
VRIWAHETPERPWPIDGPKRAHLPIPLEADELLREMDAAGVDRAILVPPSWEGDYNDVALRAAANHPDRFAVMDRLDLSQPGAPAALPKWRDQPGMLGIRLTFLSDIHKAWLAKGALDAFWRAAEAAEIPLMVLPPDQIPAIVEIAKRHPKLKLIIDHLAMTSIRIGAAASGTVKDILPLADCPNVAVKASALPC